ncbi:hypothetical protein CSKR_108472, partial [Clonorchis sinensis]
MVCERSLCDRSNERGVHWWNNEKKLAPQIRFLGFKSWPRTCTDNAVMKAKPQCYLALVTSPRCPSAMPSGGSTKAEIKSSCSSLDRSSRDAEVGFEPRNFR